MANARADTARRKATRVRCPAALSTTHCLTWVGLEQDLSLALIGRGEAYPNEVVSVFSQA